MFCADCLGSQPGLFGGNASVDFVSDCGKGMTSQAGLNVVRSLANRAQREQEAQEDWEDSIKPSTVTGNGQIKQLGSNPLASNRILTNTTRGTGAIATTSTVGGLIGDWVPRFEGGAAIQTTYTKQKVCGLNRVLTNGNLSISFDGNYAAISQVLFGGRDWYNPGTPVSDYAIAIDGNFYHFQTYAYGYTETPYDVVARVCGSTKITVDRFSQWSSVGIKREYRLVGNGFIAKTVFANRTGAPVLVEFAETFDPDQDFDFSFNYNTKNSIISIGGVSAAQSVGEDSDYTVIMGSSNPEAVVEAAGNGVGFFQIDNYADLQTFLSNPQDGGGVAADLGIHCGFSTTLSPSSSYTFSMAQGFGTTTAEAQSAFLNALSQM